MYNYILGAIMCGIVGSIGKKYPYKYIVDGLSALDYRGYDSAGLACLAKDILVYKDKGSVAHLNDIIDKSIDTNVAIGHTRWATHGVPSKKNSHPHLSFNKEFAIVHNGVLENYQELKEELLDNGYSFYSDTDTEALIDLIEYYYLNGDDVLTSINKVMHEVRGSYAAVIIHKGEEALYILKNSSPLLVGLCDGYNLVASDVAPMISDTNSFIELDDYQYGVLTSKECHIYDLNKKEIKPEIISKEIELVKHDLCGYPHYMLKEIYEIDTVINRLIKAYSTNNGFNFPRELIDEIMESDQIIFLGCGTSYHASLVGGRFFEELGIPSSSYIASEWAFNPMFPGKKPFIIIISQSGETADLIHCLQIINKNGYRSLVITNTDGSTLQRKATYSLLLYAGVEVSVASTKAYVAQVALLLLLVNAMKGNYEVAKELEHAINIIRKIQKEQLETIKDIAQKIKGSKDVFYLGRGFDYYLSLEASLKLKEISYIHSEAIPGGELKHGPIALMDNGLPVIVFVTDHITASSMRGNIQEVKSRGADVYVISTKELAKQTDNIILDNYPNYLSGIIASSVAFFLAYYVSLYKGLNVDKPRNLAKSVTVE